jgi:alkylation response protein AidB-like acyl-CoA dehydrogenase
MTLFAPTAAWVQDEHKMFAESCARFMADELAPNQEKWADQGMVDRDFWRKAGAAGIMAGAVPEEYGGVGGGISFDAITAYEQARKGDIGWGYGIQSIVTHYVTAYGTDAQKERWLPKLTSG